MKTKFKPILVTEDVHLQLMRRKAEERKRSVCAVIDEMLNKEVTEHETGQ